MRFRKLQFIQFYLSFVFVLGATGCKGSAMSGSSAFMSSKTVLLQRAQPIDSANKKDDWRTLFLQRDSTKSYEQVKAEIAKIKTSIVSKELSSDSLGALFTELLVFRIIPYWYGTPWTFEGHTAIPNQGEIACGYFVSTTLLHAGVNINRYKLAQQLPIHEAQSLALTDSVLVISHPTTEEIIHEIEIKTVEGIYFLGFDQSHVGFLLKRKDQLYVIHANYVGGAVAVELVEESLAFAAYRKFYVCPLSTNESFLKKWQKNQVLTVIETP